MTFWLALLLGVVQGITEFIPVSSSGHLAIFEQLFGLKQPAEGYVLLTAMLHLGTLIAVLIALRRDLAPMLRTTIEHIQAGGGAKNPPPAARTLGLVLLATVPLIIALFFYGSVAKLYKNLTFVGIAMLGTGVILYVSETFLKSGKTKSGGLTPKNALLIGIGQLIAVLPGVSRLAITTSFSRAVGLERNFALRFSLLLSIPAILGGTVISLINAVRAKIDWTAFPLYIVGLIVSALIGLVAIRVLWRIMRSRKLVTVAYYCAAVGGLTFILSLIF
ncbi:MAG: undecaprenyl-diphosphate phosphatase [Oscillospiraceae bacterium]|jgi:undecaprenyl-diphosphatase|nr:undecaprenyl-diphosphate phosphatase [Oscillospiraceae bacterium]